MMHGRKLLLLALWIFLHLAPVNELAADELANDPAATFSDGVRLYEAKEYASAAAAFDSAASAVPDNDDYLYWRGKAYGRMAEHAGWFSAIKFAKVTRESLERAVTINPNNAQAVADLARYYSEAPSFLGGDETKAQRLREHLGTLRNSEAVGDQTPAP